MGGVMIGNIFGLFGRSAIFIFNICMLPLTIYALMVWQGWDWVKAGVAALILAAIPVIGAIGSLALAVMGLYFLALHYL
jgi:hypothetical protein